MRFNARQLFGFFIPGGLRYGKLSFDLRILLGHVPMLFLKVGFLREHVFGAQETAPGGRIVRTIGMVRARAKIGPANLAYNIRRLVTLERMANV